MLESLVKYFLTCPQIKKLYTLFGVADDNKKQFCINAPEIVKDFIGGGKVGYIDIFINCFNTADVTEDTKNDNLVDFSECQKICDWIALQGQKNNYPTLPFGKVTDILPLPIMPQVAGVDKNGIAKYMVSARINFYEA